MIFFFLLRVHFFFFFFFFFGGGGGGGGGAELMNLFHTESKSKKNTQLFFLGEGVWVGLVGWLFWV